MQFFDLKTEQSIDLSFIKECDKIDQGHPLFKRQHEIVLYVLSSD